MGILSGAEIKRQVAFGNIEIDPFREDRIGPNSYDVCLGPKLIKFWDVELDITKEIKDFQEIDIRGGFVLLPGIGYLGSTVERIHCKGLVPWIDGRSTLGRYFVQAHQTAGRGDDGFNGTFTLELLAVFRPVKIYPFIPLAQVSFFMLEGKGTPYSGRYIDQTGPRLPKPFKMEEKC